MGTREETQGFSLKDKTVCLIGIGGLGCNIAVHLAGAGVGKLHICDFDTVSESNLNRQFLYTGDDIGKSKSKRAKLFLSAYGSGTVTESHNLKIETTDDAPFVKDCDIIICAVDNAQGRDVCQKLADHFGTPLVVGGIDGFYGTAYLYVPGRSPCLSCAGFDAKAKAKYNISSVAGLIGSVEADLAINYLLKEDVSLSGNLLLYDEGRFDTLKITGRKGCPVCKKMTLRGE